MVDLLIIGKSGQLGSALVAIAKEKKMNFVAYSRKDLDVTKNHSLEKIQNNIKPKVIINTSAYHVISYCETNPAKAFAVNSIAVAKLAKVARKINAKFITYSTDYVFDGKKGAAYKEQDRPNPLQMYGLSKFAGEIAALNEYDKGTYVIRTSGLYGKGKLGSRSKKGNFILTVLKEAKKNGVVFASKKQIVNPTYALDLAKSTLDLLDAKAPPGIYHLANEGSCSWYVFAKSILMYKKIKIKVTPFKGDGKMSDFKRPRCSVLGNNEAKKYGVKLPTINEGLVRYLKEI